MSLTHLLTHCLNKESFTTSLKAYFPLKALIASLFVCLLSACGQKGPLFLPEEKEPVSTLSTMNSAETQSFLHKEQYGDA